VSTVLKLQIRVLNMIEDLKNREEGQGVVEYSLILGLVVVGAITFLTSIGTDVKNVLSNVVSGLGGA
jgi:pilus assembly protein Flp/PilA